MLISLAKVEKEPQAFNGNTPLHMAAKFGKIDAVTELVMNAVDLDRENNQGWTALHMAAWRSHNGIISLLITAGSSFDIEDKDGKTAKDVAADSTLFSALALDVSANTDDIRSVLSMAFLKRTSVLLIFFASC